MKPKIVPLQIATKAPVAPPPAKEKEAFSDASVADPSSALAEAGVGKNRKILVVDDNPVVLKAFELKLKTKGFSVVTSSEGNTIVSLIGQENPDLILLDINFGQTASTSAQWNGFTIIQWLKRFQEIASIPIIIVSGDDPAKSRDKFMAAGAVGYFQKPVKFDELLSEIIRILDSPKQS